MLIFDTTVTHQIDRCCEILTGFLAKETSRLDMEDTAARYRNALHELAGLGREKEAQTLTFFPVSFTQLKVSVFLSTDPSYSITYSPQSYVLGLSKFYRIFSELTVKTSHEFNAYVGTHLPATMSPSLMTNQSFSLCKETICCQDRQSVRDVKAEVQLVSVEADQEKMRLSTSLAGYEMTAESITILESTCADRQLMFTFQSVCAHHTFPFFGTIALHYIGPEYDRSCLQQRLDFFVKRFQTQEDITWLLYHQWLPDSVETRHIRIVSEHTCMTERGVRAHDALTVTEMPLTR